MERRNMRLKCDSGKELYESLIRNFGSHGFTMTYGAETNLLDKISKVLKALCMEKGWEMTVEKEKDEDSKERKKSINPL